MWAAKEGATREDHPLFSPGPTPSRGAGSTPPRCHLFLCPHDNRRCQTTSSSAAGSSTRPVSAPARQGGERLVFPRRKNWSAPYPSVSTAYLKLPSTVGNTATIVPPSWTSAALSTISPTANFDIENSSWNYRN